MAISKITGSGIGAVNAPVEFTSADNLSQLTLSSTDADSNVGPRLDLTRNSASPADSDYIGQITHNKEADKGKQTHQPRLDSVLDIFRVGCAAYINRMTPIIVCISARYLIMPVFPVPVLPPHRR